MDFFKKIAQNELGKLFNNQEWFEDPSVFKISTPLVEQELKEEKEKLERTVMDDAEDTVKKGYPKEQGDKLSSYLKPFASSVGTLCEKVHSQMQCSGLARYKRRVMTITEEKVMVLQKEQAEFKNKVRALERKLRDLKARNIFSMPLFAFLICVVVFFIGVDAAYNATAFQALGLGNIKAWTISLVVVIGISVAGYELIEELRKDETEKKSWYKITGLSVFILCIFLGIAYLRINYLNVIGEQSISIIFSVPVFMIINVLIFGVTSWVIHSFFPTREQRKIHSDLMEVDGELKEMNKSLKRAIDDEKDIKTEASNRIQRADDLMDYSDDLIKELLSFYEKITGQWIKEVTLLLPYTPDCMEQEIPKVKYRLVNRDDGQVSPKPSPSNDNNNSSTFNNYDYA